MFTEREMFFPEFDAEQAQMTHYLSMLKSDIRQFDSTQHCDTLLELQEVTMRHELEIELQLREQRKAPTHSQPVPKRSKTADSRSGGKCGKGQSGVCRSGSVCRKRDKEGHFTMDCREPAPVPDMRICYHCH